jgi:hypothetical protein
MVSPSAERELQKQQQKSAADVQPTNSLKRKAETLQETSVRREYFSPYPPVAPPNRITSNSPNLPNLTNPPNTILPAALPRKDGEINKISEQRQTRPKTTQRHSLPSAAPSSLVHGAGKGNSLSRQPVPPEEGRRGRSSYYTRGRDETVSVSPSAQLRAPLRSPTPDSPLPTFKAINTRSNTVSAGVPGPQEIPVGADNCLMGLSFLFTGYLENLSYEKAKDLVTRHGGRVTTLMSNRTSFAVVGSEVIPARLKRIHSLKIKTIDKDDLFALIRLLPVNGRDSRAGPSGLLPSKRDEVLSKMSGLQKGINSCRAQMESMQKELIQLQLILEVYDNANEK